MAKDELLGTLVVLLGRDGDEIVGPLSCFASRDGVHSLRDVRLGTVMRVKNLRGVIAEGRAKIWGGMTSTTRFPNLGSSSVQIHVPTTISTTSASPVDVLLFPVKEGETWAFFFKGTGTGTNGVGAIFSTVAPPSSTTLDGWWVSPNNVENTGQFAATYGYPAGGSPGGLLSGAGPVELWATVTAGSDGSAGVAFASATTGGHTSTVSAGAYLIAWRTTPMVP